MVVTCESEELGMKTQTLHSRKNWSRPWKTTNVLCRWILTIKSPMCIFSGSSCRIYRTDRSAIKPNKKEKEKTNKIHTVLSYLGKLVKITIYFWICSSTDNQRKETVLKGSRGGHFHKIKLHTIQYKDEEEEEEEK